ncbi:F0F1 ATP synthase subunit A [Mycoplasma yeatsii]|uniref:F-type H+-transporting ATPase subunit a n=1 Tax=Mycoplasma yeatsii TaxID=51365 RepID=A0ABU0NEY8_9MOLU|nr:F0F1 ATP synthase subunit A [Mycoplasma yeatsii]MDQ0567982.1 F-type H+-transporting ATPase subunit a [Mycoplasma yeatsii]
MTLMSIADNFKKWDSFTSSLITIFLVTAFVCTISIIYNKKIRSHKVDEKMSGFLVLINMFVLSVENIVTSILGKKYKKATPYAMYLLSYIFLGSVVSLLGFESQTTSFTVTFSMGLVTFVMIYYFGFKYQRMGFTHRYINPIEIFSQFTPLLSISFRLFGNLLGGSIILGLLYALLIGFQLSWATESVDNHWISYYIWNPSEFPDANEAWKLQYKYFWAGLNIFTTPLAPMLHIYFDLFDGLIQAIVFTMLTLSYWGEQIQIDEESHKADEAVENMWIEHDSRNQKQIIQLN